MTRFRLIAGRPIGAGQAANDEPPSDGIAFMWRVLCALVTLLGLALAAGMIFVGLR